MAPGRHLGPGEQRPHGQDEVADEGSADRSDADPVRGRQVAGGAGGVGEERVDARQDGVRPGQHQLTEGRGRGSGPPPVEQDTAEHRLDAAQLRAEARLRHGQRGGGPGEAVGLGDRAHHAQVPYLQFHVAHVMER